MECKLKDIAIIGSGPGGITAAIYATRAGLTVDVFEKMVVGGNAATTYNIDNYPGFSNISGAEFAMKLYEHVNELEIPIQYETIEKIVKNEEGNYELIAGDKKFCAKNIIVATGSRPRGLGAPGETEYEGKGVSYCATCDGMFFKGKTVAVVGGGNTALEDAIVLANLCKKVYVLIRSDKFRGYASLQEKVEALDNVEIIKEVNVTEFLGDGERLNKIVTTKGEIELDGVFLAIGTIPNSKIVEGICDLNQYGEIITDDKMRTSAETIYAIGDVRDTKQRQIITAMADAVYAINAII